MEGFGFRRKADAVCSLQGFLAPVIDRDGLGQAPQAGIAQHEAPVIFLYKVIRLKSSFVGFERFFPLPGIKIVAGEPTYCSCIVVPQSFARADCPSL